MTFDQLVWWIFDMLSNCMSDKEILDTLQLGAVYSVSPEQLVGALRKIERRLK